MSDYYVDGLCKSCVRQAATLSCVSALQLQPSNEKQLLQLSDLWHRVQPGLKDSLMREFLAGSVGEERGS